MRRLMMIRALWLAVLMCVPLLYAQEPEPPAPAAEESEPQTEGERLRALFQDIDDVIGSVELTEADVDEFLEHRESFRKAMEADEEFLELENSSFKQAFEHATGTEAFKDWETGLGINGKDWLRKGYRIRTLFAHMSMGDAIEEARDDIRESRELLERTRDMLPVGQYEEGVADLDEAEATLDDLEEARKELPSPTATEQKLIEARKDDLEKALSA